MAEQTILEWRRDELRLLLADGSAGASKVRAAAAKELTAHADPAIPVAEAGAALRVWLAEHHCSGGPVTLVLPREGFVLRRLKLPAAPIDDLPDLVRFQTATRTSAPIESLAIDFIPLPGGAPESGLEAMTVSLDREQLARITAVCAAAGLEPASLMCSPFTIARLLRARPAPDLGQGAPDLVVYQQGSRVELSIFEFGTLVFSHAVQLTEEPGVDRYKPLKSELARSLVALNQAQPDANLERCLYVSGAADASLVDILRQRFGAGFRLVDLAQVSPGAEAAGYEALLGAALSERDELLHLDLLHPRRRREAPDRRKLYWSLGAGGAALALLLAMGVFYSRKGALETSISVLQAELSTGEQRVLKGKPRAEAYARIAKWKEADADAIDLWTGLQQRFQQTDRIYLIDLKIIPQQGDVLARFTGKGQAKTRADVDDMTQTLSESGYRVKPTTPTLGKRGDPDYPWGFELDVDLPRPAPSPASARTLVPAAGATGGAG
jgi:hypothetical protein